MIKCKDCKAFSPQSEYGGVCNFTNFGTVKNNDGCHAGAIINDICNLDRATAIDEFVDKLPFSFDGRISESTVRQIAEQLKEQNK